MKKKIISVSIILILILSICGCENNYAKHNYTYVNIDSYTTEDIEFYTEHKSYSTDDIQIECYFTYNGNKDFVHLSDISNCFLIKKTKEVIF